MPSGFEGGYGLNQLQGKDDIEDPVDLVKTEVKTRRRISLEDRSNAPPIKEEIQNLPYHPGATVPSKGATKIIMPNKVSSMGPQPRSNLYTRQNRQYGSPRGTSLKRGLFKSPAEFPNDQSRPRKQQKISAMEQASVDSDDEVMEVNPPCKKKGAQQPESRKLSQSENTSKYPQDSQDLPDKMDVDLKQQEFSKEGVAGSKPKKSEANCGGEKGFINKFNSLSEVPVKGSTLSTHPPNKPEKWSYKSSGDIKTTIWTGPNKKRTSMPPPRRKKIDPSKTEINLLCFQWGIKSYSIERDSQGLFIRISSDELVALHGEKGKEQEIWSIDLKDISPIKCVNVNTPSRKFSIKAAHRPDFEPDRTVIFTLQGDEDVEDFKSNFFKKRLGNDPSEVEEKTFDNLANKLKEWEGRKRADITEKPLGPAVTHQHTTYQVSKKPQELSHVEITVPRRSPRNMVDKTKNTPPKRPRASSTEDIESPPREMRSSMLELPKPPWKNPLVYPPTGPRKEVVDYDDLKRLNSNSYLNDNIINFYLKYIEVQLHKKCPEVAKETYFLNTFFYERLTKRDEKRKRDFDSVLKWTAKVDIFKTSYIIIPINEATHWYLAIVCNLCNLERKMNDKAPGSPGNKSTDLESNGTLDEPKEDDQDVPSEIFLDSNNITGPLVSTTRDGGEHDVEIIETQDNLEQMVLDNELSIEDENRVVNINDSEIIEVEDSSPQRPKPNGRGKQKAKNKSPPKKNRNAVPHDTPSIIILDSMGFGPTAHNGTIRNLREWLKIEADAKRNLSIATEDIHAAFGKAPNQNNWYDCGLFLLHYVELFFEQPTEFTSMFLARGDRVSDQALWRKEEINGMREKLFHLFIRLHNEQETPLAEQRVLHQRGNLNGNGNRDTSQKVGIGSGPSQNLTAIDVKGPAMGKGSQSTRTVSEATAASKDPEFEKSTCELEEELYQSGRSGEKGTSTSLEVQVTDKLAVHPISLGASNNILQPRREIAPPFRDSRDGGGVIT